MNSQKLKLKKQLLVSLLVTGLTMVATSQAFAAYTFTDLGFTAGVFSKATAINNFGQVVGYSSFNGNTYHAALWIDGVATDLGTLGGGSSYAYDINDTGKIIGSSYNSTGNLRATEWGTNSIRDISNGVNTEANGINNAGIIVGWTSFNGTPSAPNNAALTVTSPTAAVSIIIGGIGSTASVATAINDNSFQVVGYTQALSTGTSTIATFWNGNNKTFLSGVDSRALDINNSESIVGFSTVNGFRHATLWNGNTVTDLGTLGDTYSYANAINASGQIVGAHFNAYGSHAALWDGTTAIDLNSFLDASSVAAGWILTEATGINNNGWIVGNASNSLLGITNHAFVLAAVPEPDSYAMALMGLGLMGFVARRRKSMETSA